MGSLSRSQLRATHSEAEDLLATPDTMRNGTRLTATRVPKANSNDRTRLTVRFVSCKVWYCALLALIVAGFTILTEAQTAGSQSIGSSPACPSKTRPIYQCPFLRYDEGWSFLSCSHRTDRWDRIKYLPPRKEWLPSQHWRRRSRGLRILRQPILGRRPPESDRMGRASRLVAC
jgi:hypothetical protein